MKTEVLQHPPHPIAFWALSDGDWKSVFRVQRQGKSSQNRASQEIKKLAKESDFFTVMVTQ
jgi:hypothetical protein